MVRIDHFCGFKLCEIAINKKEKWFKWYQNVDSFKLRKRKVYELYGKNVLYIPDKSIVNSNMAALANQFQKSKTN